MPDNSRTSSAQDKKLLSRQKLKLSDQVYEVVLRDIVNGRYPEGSKLATEAMLADEFSVSRPVVREALARLRDDGLIERKQGAGSFVLIQPGTALMRFAPIGSIADIQRCFEFRLSVEPAAASLAAARRNPEDLAKIEAATRLLDEAIKAGTVDVESDITFHHAVAEASNNRFFSTTVKSLEGSMRTAMLLNRQLSLQHPLERLGLVLEEHRSILDAIASGDRAKAFDAMKVHIGDARRRIFDDGD